MAMLASKTSFPAPLGSGSGSISASTGPSPGLQSSRRVPLPASSSHIFTSPTDSEFADADGPESAKNCDEEQVCDWLRSVNCGDYEKIFKKNNINGENLLEMDKAVLQEMGIDKIGDRVRLFLGIKKLRTKAYANQKKRNRVSPSDFNSTTWSDLGRTPLPAWIYLRTHRRQLALHDLLTLVAEFHPHLQQIRDTRGSLISLRQ
jgi:mitogen-activated protein kinase kinase kinase